jgi:hypothetical protein
MEEQGKERRVREVRFTSRASPNSHPNAPACLPSISLPPVALTSNKRDAGGDDLLAIRFNGAVSEVDGHARPAVQRSYR